MQKLKVLDLFSGIGGFSLGLERTGGFETVAFCEIETLPRRVLAKHWPEVPIYEDVRTLTAETLARGGIAVDVITGGFPCQAFSSAARGRNNAPDLWPEMARLAVEVKPRYAIAENVKFGPVARSADYFCELGMQCDVVHIPAYEIGADHERSRWWAVAHPYTDGEFQRALNAEAQKLRDILGCVWGAENYRMAVQLSDGLPGRLGAGMFGNAVVPQIPELIGRAILAAETKTPPE
jgi:DNA (cytosine-5)-methyltransferase 1